MIIYFSEQLFYSKFQFIKYILDVAVIKGTTKCNFKNVICVVFVYVILGKWG